MSDEQVLDLQKNLHSVSTRVPKIIVRRVEEMFPSLKEGLVSTMCLFVKKQILLSHSQVVLQLAGKLPIC